MNRPALLTSKERVHNTATSDKDQRGEMSLVPFEKIGYHSACRASKEAVITPFILPTNQGQNTNRLQNPNCSDHLVLTNMKTSSRQQTPFMAAVEGSSSRQLQQQQSGQCHQKWQVAFTHEHSPVRSIVMLDTLRLMQQVNPTKVSLERSKMYAQKMEQILFLSALTKEEYMDLNTLKVRLKIARRNMLLLRPELQRKAGKTSL